MSCDIGSVVNSIYTDLLSNTNFQIPEVDLTGDDFDIPDPNLTGLEIFNNGSITSKEVNGTGIFDVIMSGVSAHLLNEYKNNRIVGAEYTKNYAAMLEAALSNGITFLLQKNQSILQTETLKVQLVTARMDAAAKKIELAKLLLDAENSKIQHALNKIKLAEAESTYCAAKYNLENILPLQKELLEEQVEGADISNSTASYNLNTILPKQSTLLTSQTGNTNADTAAKLRQRELLDEQIESEHAKTSDTKTDGSPVGGAMAKDKALQTAQLALTEEQKALLSEQIEAARGQTATTRRDGSPIGGIVGSEIAVKAKQVDLMDGQVDLMKEQVETARAATLGTRTDGTPVAGSIGTQTALHQQQIISFQRDAQLKALRVYTEAWLANKTVDEGIDTPPSFSAVQLEPLLQKVKLTNNLVD